VRAGSAASGSPASAQAPCAATIAELCVAVRASRLFRRHRHLGVEVATRADAILDPDCCAQSASNNVSGSSPIDDTTPRPVTTTPLHQDPRSELTASIGVADEAMPFRRVVGDLDVVAVLQRLDQLDEVERVDVEIGPGRLGARLFGAGDLDGGELVADGRENLVSGDCAHVFAPCCV
jgi:hypothetical protein